MERALFEVISGLLARGWRVRLITRRSDLPPHPFLEVDLVRAPARPFLAEDLAFGVGASQKLRQSQTAALTISVGALVPQPVDVVILQYLHAMAGAAAARTRNGIRRVNERAARSLALRRERAVYHSVPPRAVLAVSDELATGFERSFPDVRREVLVVPNGVDTARFRPDGHTRESVRAELGMSMDTRLACFVGGDWDRKGLGIAVEAMGRTRAPWHLVVVGRGNADRLLAENRAVADRLHVIGECPDPETYLKAADAFVFPSSYEGFPLACVEAAACGLPLIVSEGAHARPLLDHGAAGTVVARDASAVAAELDLLDLDELRATTAERADLISARYGWTEVVTMHEQLYTRLMAS